MTIQEAPICFHCHLPIPSGFTQNLDYQEVERGFCCVGCYSIAETIIRNGLDDYYKFRSSVAPQAVELIPEELQVFDDDDVIENLCSKIDDNRLTIELFCENLQCSACSWLIERRIGSIKGVKKVNSSITDNTISLEWDSSAVKLSKLLQDFHQLGYPVKAYDQSKIEVFDQQQNKLWLKRLGLAGLGMMQVMMYAVAMYIGAFEGIDSSHQTFLRWVSFVVATPVMLYSGYPFFSSAIRAIKSKSVNMDVPIALALALAYGASIWATFTQSGEVYFDSVTMFVFFLLIGRYLEYRARQKVKQQFHHKDVSAASIIEKIELKNSLRMTSSVPIQKISIGDTIVIKPGSIIPLDGTMVKGRSSISEAMLSGEFMPVNKTTGDTVLAGSVNGDSPIELEVTHARDSGFLHRIKQLQRQALLNKSSVTLIADRIARYFVSLILILAVTTFSYWYLTNSEDALWITISVLVVSCPCALSLATPVALTCGVSSLNKQNVLVQEKDFLQKLNKTTDVILDKTGTLTKGELSVKSIVAYQEKSEVECLAMIAAMEVESEHPIAKAFSNHLSTDITADDIKLHPYAGVSAKFDHTSYWFGNRDFIASKTKLIKEDLNDDSLYLSSETSIIAEITLTDTLRDDVDSVCQELLAKGMNLHLLSGDPSNQVQELASRLHINNWKNNLKPSDKLEYIRQIKSNTSNAMILTIGDGVNDAPAMALSDTSIAMAGSSDLTKSQANSYLLSGKLSDILSAFVKADKTNAIIRQNISWAILYNLLVLPFAIAGMIPPYLAAVGMSLSSIVVVLNSLRLNKAS